MYFKIFTILLSIVLLILLFKTKYFSSLEKKEKFILVGIILVAVVLRLYKYENLMGLNLDEAMGGYNSWSLANYGVDDHLKAWPVYLIAWGAGMNILYPAIAIPFVKIFGLSLLSYRYPMIICSILGMFALLYVLGKCKLNKKFILTFIALLYLNPWMIMANRWSLESNLFPLIIIFSVASFMLWSQVETRKKKIFWLVIWNALIALSAYAYSNNWLMLAFFVPTLYIILFLQKKFKVKEIIIGLLTELLMLLPLLGYIMVNFFNLPSFKFLWMTIPKLEANRAATQMIFNEQGSLLVNIIKNIYASIKVLMTGDNFIWSNVPVYGLLYPGMWLFVIFGVIYIIRTRKNDILNVLMLSMLISCLPIIMFIHPNANHLNAMIVPIFYFMTIGVLALLQKAWQFKTGIVCFVLLLVGFSYSYFVENAGELRGSNGLIEPVELKEAIEVATANKNWDVCFINPNNNAMYTITRFYEPISPYKYVETQGDKVSTEVGTNPLKYDKWDFVVEPTLKLKTKKHTAFIVERSVDSSYLPSGVKYQGTYGDYYDVYIPKK